MLNTIYYLFFPQYYYIMNYFIIILLIILIIILNYNYLFDIIKNSNTNLVFNYANKSLACLYAYYEKDETYKNNLLYFLENGILDNVDYYIIINGNCSIDIPKKSNIIVFHRENKGYDFGAFSYAIKYINKEYDYYFFLNTSVKGPLLKNNSRPWTEYFLELFNSPEIKLVGTTINIFPLSRFEKHDLDNIYNHSSPHTHVQSMFFCIDNEFYKYLKKENFFNEEELNNAENISYVIAYKEIGLSQLCLNNNWNIN